MTDHKEFSIAVPVDIYERLSRLDEDRLDEVMVESVEDALTTVSEAEAKQDELKEKMGLSGRDSEELSDKPSDAVERRQAELHEAMGLR